MTVTPRKFYLSPTKLVPNSPQPLLHYEGVLAEAERHPAGVNGIFDKHGWKTQWIFRYGPTQASHYHSSLHECMAVLTGTATIRFGVADTSDDLDKSTWGNAKEVGGVEIKARAGDVFVIPAGVAHKTYNTKPEATFGLLTPGEGHGVQADNVKEALEKLKLSGFTMLGAYPKNCGDWDFMFGGEDAGHYASIWSTAKPEMDPLLGTAPEGVWGQWKVVPRLNRRHHVPYAKI